MSWLFLSKNMLDSEAPMVYSGAYGGNLRSINNFTISSSQSQGFCWNQDLFASQYQQMCKVIYDGHEDTIEGLIASIKQNYDKINSETTRQQNPYSRRRHGISGSHRFMRDDCNTDEGDDEEDEEEDGDEDGDQDMNYDDEDEALTDCEDEPSTRHHNRVGFVYGAASAFSVHPLASDQFSRPRRISERSMSFVSESKHGNYDRSECADIDVEEETPENQHLKWLISS